jgi:hypothetical protein
VCPESDTTNSTRLLTIGLCALVVANVGSYILQRKHLVNESVADPVSGFLMGAAITILIIAIYRRGRSLRGEVSRDR